MKKPETEKWNITTKDGMMLEGYTKANNLLIHQITYEYGASATILYILILSHKNSSDSFAWPSIALLQKEMCVSRATIVRLLADLVEGGYLFVSSGDSAHSNRYYFPKESFFRETDIAGLSRREKIPKSKDTLATEKKPLVDKKEKTPPKPQDVDSLPITVEDEFEGFEF